MNVVKNNLRYLNKGLFVRNSHMMTTSEAFVETLAKNKVKNTFGIAGSAFMDSLHSFPTAGIRFIPVQHEQNAAHMADGYARASNKHGVCIAQNGPGISNFITGIASAYWSHSPVIAITPQSSSLTQGLGGFQEVNQLPMFSEITKHQTHITHPKRMAELVNYSFYRSMLDRGPVQINIPRDYFYYDFEMNIPEPLEINRPAPNPTVLNNVIDALKNAKNPFILAGGGVNMSNSTALLAKFAEKFSIPVATTYLHNDSFPCNNRFYMGPLGYQGSKSAMQIMKNSDLVLALGTRLGPFGTLPQYDIDYWPKHAKIVQVDIDPNVLGLVKETNFSLHADVNITLQKLLSLTDNLEFECTSGKSAHSRMVHIDSVRNVWKNELDEMRHISNNNTRGNKISPREALHTLEKNLPTNDLMLSTDIGNICSVANSYLNFREPNSFFAAMSYGSCGYAFPTIMGAKIACPHKTAIAYVGDGAWGMSMAETLTCVRENIPVTAVVFNNGQWGAEKKNQVLWFNNKYIGTQLDNPSFAEIANAMGAKGIKVSDKQSLSEALHESINNQKNGKTTIIEVMVTKELGEPFRRDAMKLPNRFLDKYSDDIVIAESSSGQPTDL